MNGTTPFLNSRTWTPFFDASMATQMTTARRASSSASATGAVSLWRYDGPADRPLMEAARHRGEVYSIACTSTAEGVIVASGDFNGDIEVSRLSSNVLKSMRTFFRTDGPISAVTGGTAATGPFLACAGATGPP